MNKAVFLLFITITFFRSLGYSLPATEVRGGSFEIRQVVWTWDHRHDFFKSCMMDPDACGKRDSLYPYMQKLEGLLKENKSTKMAFYSESTHPDLFNSDADETHRVATTGDTPGSVIAFNIDRLRNLTIEQTTAILFHELSHHLGLKDDQLRIPDQIGARVARHVSRNLKISYLDQTHSLHLKSAVFQSFIPEFYTGSYNFGDFGFLTDGDLFLNLNMNSFDISPACDRSDAVPGMQSIDSALAWTKITDTQVFLSTPIKNFCVWFDPVQRKASYDILNRSFQMNFKINSTWKIDAASIETTLDNSIITSFDSVQTLQFVKADFNQVIFGVGDALKITVVVKSFTSIDFDQCSGGMAHQDAPKQINGWPVMEDLDSCEIIAHEKDFYTLRFTHSLKALQKSGSFSLTALKLTHAVTSNKSSAFLILLKNEIPFQLKPNPLAENKIELVSITAVGLKSIAKFANYPLENSFMYEDGSVWTLDIRVRSRLKVSLRVFASSFLLRSNDKLLNVHQLAEIKDLSHFIKGVTTTIDGAEQVFHVKIAVPATYTELPVYGLVLDGILFQDEALNFLDYKKSEKFSYLFMSKLLMDAN